MARNLYKIHLFNVAAQCCVGQYPLLSNDVAYGGSVSVFHQLGGFPWPNPAALMVEMHFLTSQLTLPLTCL